MLARFRLKALAGVAACLLASTAYAQHAGKGHGHDNDSSNAARVGVDGSGRLRALSPEEARELVAGMARFVDQSDAGLKSTQLPFGVMLDLEDRFQSVSLARLAGDGTVVTRCVGGAGEALDFLTHVQGRSPIQPGIDAQRLRAAKRRAAPVVVLEEK